MTDSYKILIPCVKFLFFIGLCIGCDTLSGVLGRETAFGAILANQLVALFFIAAVTIPFVSVDKQWSYKAVPSRTVSLHFMAVGLFLFLSQLAGNFVLNHQQLVPAGVKTLNLVEQERLLYQIVGTVIAAPVFEEFAFRALLLPVLIVWFSFAKNHSKNSKSYYSLFMRLVSEHRVILAMLLSSVFFSFGHSQTWFAVVFQGSFGMFQAFAYLATGSILLVVIMHLTWNLIITILENLNFGYQLTMDYEWALATSITCLVLTILLFTPLFRRFQPKVSSTMFPYSTSF